MLETDVERILGVDIAHKLKQITAAIYLNVDEDLESLKKRYEALRSVISELYPKRKVIQIEFQLTEAKKNA